MTAELLKNFYTLLESHKAENMRLAFELAKGMELDWGEEAYYAWWHLYQMRSLLYAQHQEILAPVEEEELLHMIAVVHRVKRLSIDAKHLDLIPKSHAERLIQLEYIEIKGFDDYTPLLASDYLRNRCKEFRIIDCKLDLLPEQLRQFKQIHSLNCSKNKLKQLPSWIGELKELRVLNLNFNALDQLPESMLNLKNLRSLWLAGNALSTLPDWITGFKNLQYLYVFDNPGLGEGQLAALRAAMPHCTIHGR